MRRLRAFLSAGRRARGAGVIAAAGADVRTDGVGRRGLSGFIAVAPVALPAAVRAAAAPAFIDDVGGGP